MSVIVREGEKSEEETACMCAGWEACVKGGVMEADLSYVELTGMVEGCQGRKLKG